MNSNKIKLVRITTAPISMRLLITGQPAYMKQAGFDVTLISAEGNDWNFIPHLNDYNVHKVDMARQIDIKKDIKALFALIRLFRKIKPHIVHTHTPKAGLLGMLAARISGVPVRIHTLAGMPLMTASGMKRKILFQTEKLTFSASNETWPNSKLLYRYIIDHKMISSDKAHIILNGSSNGIELHRYNPKNIDQERIAAIKKQYNISDEHFCFLAVGRMVNDKGIKELLTSFLHLYKSNPNIRLILLGPFETADALDEITVQTIKSHSAIVHIDWSDEVEKFMFLSQCFVHASHREGFPNVVLQAGAMGIPVICSDIPGNIDIVENEQEGTVFPVKNQQSLQAAMQHVMNHYEEALTKAKVLNQKVVNCYDRIAVHQAIKERYIHLLKEKNIDVSSVC